MENSARSAPHSLGSQVRCLRNIWGRNPARRCEFLTELAAQAVRSDCGINETVVSDDDLRKMFAAVDSDGSLTMDAEEFQAFIESNALAQVRNTPMLFFGSLAASFCFENPALRDEY